LSGPLFGEPSVLSNYRYRFLIAEQLEEIGVAAKNLVLEPVGRNTAAAACIAALIAARADADALVLLAPSDHLIPDSDAFAQAIAKGVAAAEEGALVTFGITPDCPHTGYGYIEAHGDERDNLTVRRFVEKPSLNAAEAFLDNDAFYWNAGLFLFKPASMLRLLQTHAPNVLDACQRSLADASEDLGFQVLNGSYSEVPAISLDYAIAEKASNMICVPLATPWSEVGSWSALWHVMAKDPGGNVTCGHS
jgi:mannose-1-phosphate guanylyltransferase / mannose-6-phosphate isomerase